MAPIGGGAELMTVDWAAIIAIGLISAVLTLMLFPD